MGDVSLFVITGNARTFMDCFESCCEHLVSKLFSPNDKTYVLFYLKLKDATEKDKKHFNFCAETLKYEDVVNKINTMSKMYNFKTINNIIKQDETNNEELLNSVQHKECYVGFLARGDNLARCLHFYFNLKRCGEIISEIENKYNFQFKNIVYVRPDLRFSESAKHIANYSSTKITIDDQIGKAKSWGCDFMAIIPRIHKTAFFEERLKFIQTNSEKHFHNSERIYMSTIDFECKHLGKFEIVRPDNINLD